MFTHGSLAATEGGLSLSKIAERADRSFTFKRLFLASRISEIASAFLQFYEILAFEARGCDRPAQSRMELPWP
jgi:hypothetical protein